MKLVKFLTAGGESTVGCLQDAAIRPLNVSAQQYRSLADILEADNPLEVAQLLSDSAAEPVPMADATLLAPIDHQEVWAAGVTYKRSKAARMEESEAAASCYDRVYDSPRPELFFKASPHRVVAPCQAVRIRRDAKWNVPEPELALVLNSRLRLVGFTVGNDMSARDIEGDNPLYLPQAKVYDACCALGPCVTLLGSMPTPEKIGIELTIHRDGQTAFHDTTDTSQLARSFEELIQWLGRDNSFPNGVFLLTGTGIVPHSEFTLLSGDQVEITIDGIGTLSNSVVQG